jgi:hypothetical protein
LLPDGFDEENEGSPAGSASWGPRSASDSTDEFKHALALAKKDADDFIRTFPISYPSPSAAEASARLLMRIFHMTGAHIEQLGDLEVQRGNLKRFQDSTLAAAIAFGDLSGRGLSIDKRKKCFLTLHAFQQQVDALLKTYRPTKG